MRLIGKPGILKGLRLKRGTPKPPKFAGTIQRNALPDLPDIHKADNPRMTQLLQLQRDQLQQQPKATEVITKVTPKPVNGGTLAEEAPPVHRPNKASKKNNAKPPVAANDIKYTKETKKTEKTEKTEKITEITEIEATLIEKTIAVEVTPAGEVPAHLAAIRLIRLPQFKPVRLPSLPRLPHLSKLTRIPKLPLPAMSTRPAFKSKLEPKPKPKLELELEPKPKPKLNLKLTPSTPQSVPRLKSSQLVDIGLISLIPVIILATQSTLYVRPIAGAYANATALAFLVGLALWRQRYRALCIVVALIPAANMVLLSLPDSMPFVRTATLYSFLLVFGLIYRHLITLEAPQGQPSQAEHTTSKIGWRGYGVVLPAMIVAGQLLGLIGYGLLRNHYAFHDTLTPVVAASAVVFALAEEVVFRGLIQQQAMAIMKPLFAGGLSTIVYAALIIGQGLPWTPIFGLLLSASLSYIYARKPNIIVTWVLNSACKLTFLGLLSAIS